MPSRLRKLALVVVIVVAVAACKSYSAAVLKSPIFQHFVARFVNKARQAEKAAHISVVFVIVISTARPCSRSGSKAAQRAVAASVRTAKKTAAAHATLRVYAFSARHMQHHCKWWCCEKKFTQLEHFHFGHFQLTRPRVVVALFFYFRFGNIDLLTYCSVCFCRQHCFACCGKFVAGDRYFMLCVCVDRSATCVSRRLRDSLCSVATKAATTRHMHTYNTHCCCCKLQFTFNIVAIIFIAAAPLVVATFYCSCCIQGSAT